jgi:osmotically-inducible protein OsmY
MMFKKSVGAIALAAAVGLGTLSVAVHGQNSLSPGNGSQTAENSGDMAARVRQALHSVPALNDKHINVSTEKGKVVISGFVDSAGDLQKAVKAANKTAGAKNVVNELTVQSHDQANTKGG